MSKSASSSARKLLSHLSQQRPMRPAKGDLLCKNGCGFYGNPEWQWYCSKCWREQQQATNKTKRVRKVEKANSDVQHMERSPEKRYLRDALAAAANAAGSSATLGRATQDKNYKQMFSKREAFESPSEPKSKSQGTPPEARAYQNELSSFLSARMDRQGVVDISRNLKTFMEKVLADSETLDVDELSTVVQEFYQNLRTRLMRHDYFKGLSDEDRDRIMDLSEQFAMVHCFKQLFCPPTTNDEDKDLELQNRIRRLNWISTKDLCCVINESSQEVRDALHRSINAILEMDSKLTPQEKLDCLVKCSKTVFELLQLSNDSPASADEFLPCLIYVCLKANPPRMHSNMNYITRFRNEEKLRMGEAGYFFANLCCAISFIENMTAESVNMETEEFDSYVSGRAVPPGSWQSSLLMCESLQGMTQNLKLLGELNVRHQLAHADALQLKEEMRTFQEDIASEVQAVLDRTSYTILGPKKPANLDDDESPPQALPAPMLPFCAAAAGVHDTPSKQQLKLDEEQVRQASTAHSEAESQSSMLSNYRGFSAQNFDIPSISCNNAIPDEDKDL